VQDTVTPNAAPRRPGASARLWALVWLGSTDEPERVGEVALIPPGRTSRIGRMGATPGSPHVEWLRQRPGVSHGTGPVRSGAVSREQLALTPRADGLVVTNLGRLPLEVSGRQVDELVAVDGAVLVLGGQLAWRVTTRPALLDGAPPPTAFGEADAWGLVGESPAMWELRRHVVFTGPRREHALVTGPSGAGKEAVARALHSLSARRQGPWVARSAATLPETLVEAELFGHAAGFPQAGMPERKGLVGEADGGTLFLDEIGEMPEAVQARLLRLMDDGEYHRLGESRARRADVRLICATNRDPERLKHDLLARLTHRVAVLGLDERPEDVPLIADALLRGILAEDPQAAAHIALPAGARPRLHPELAATLTNHRWTTHVRELRHVLFSALREATGPWLLDADLAAGPRDEGADLSSDRVQAVLDKHGGAQEPAWRELGLSSRHVLTRLVKRYGLRVRGRAT
jgi:transcriptional regulator with GAF, ATPase, and Fis domain